MESQLVVHQPESSQNLKDRIHVGTRPGHDQRAPGPKQAVRFSQDILGRSEVFGSYEHRHMIELFAFQRQGGR
jgi:hypothetical protein